MSSEEYVSFKPSEAVSGGGAISEGDYEITNALCDTTDYSGTVNPPVPALLIEYTNADGAVGTQIYTAGAAKNIGPSADKKRFRKLGSAGGLNDSTNAYAFFRSLVNAGVTEDKFGADITFIIGMKVSIVHEATKDKDIRGKAVKGSMLPVIGRIHSIPGDDPAAGSTTSPAAKSRAAATKPNGKTDAAAPAAASPGLDNTVGELLVSMLKAAGGSLPKKDILGQAFRSVKSDSPDRQAIMQRLNQDPFLTSPQVLSLGVLLDPATGVVSYIGG